ncbi:MAG: M56 family metallopeptidase [Planctomycetota bacterium]|nr:M56 family metallopeptidase [Planctomycetota bacterium]
MALGIAWALNGVNEAEFAIRVVFAATVAWLVAGAAAMGLRRSPAALRHRIWALSVLAALTLPGVVLMVPGWRVGGISGGAAKAERLDAEVGEPRAGFAGRGEVAADLRRAEMVAEGTRSGAEGLANVPLRDDPGRRTLLTAEAERRPVDWGRWMWAAWAAVAGWLVVRQAMALRAARRLLRRAVGIEEADGGACFERLRGRFGVERRPRLWESKEVGSPVCLGWWRANIVLPDEWRQWAQEKLDAVLTHELGHVARRDVLWQILARLACAVYWFCPLAWVAAWRVRVERELACDDWVLRAGESSTRYARWLLEVAELMRGRFHAADGAGVAMAARNSFEKRISAILDVGRRRFGVSRRMGMLLGVLAMGLVGLIGMLSPLTPKEVVAAEQKPVATASPTTNPAGKTFRISGRVDDEQARPVPDVMVETYSPGADFRRYAVRTAADGQFSLDVESEWFPYWELRASTGDGSKQAYDQPSDLVKDGPGKMRRLVMKPAREFAVTVNDEKGQPVGGAWVLARASFTRVGEATSDTAGKAVLRVPADAPVTDVLATKADVGSDYVLFWRKDEPKTDPYRLARDYAGPLGFVLNGVAKVSVRVVDEQQRPIAGVTVNPWLFMKPKKGSDLNLGGVTEFRRFTDERGTAEFRMIPGDNMRAITLWARKPGYTAPNRCMFDPKSGKTELEMQLVRQLRVTGRVVDGEGRGVAAATIRVGGDAYRMDMYRQQTRSAADGSFQIDVDPETYYVFVAEKDQWVSRERFEIIHKAAPAGLIQLVVERGTRVRVQVTAEADRAAVAKASVSLTQQNYGSYYSLPKDQQFPGGTTGRKGIIPGVSRHTEADVRGVAEFYVAPGDCMYVVDVFNNGATQSKTFKLSDNGQYTLYHYPNPPLNAGRTEETLKVSDEKGVEINLHLEEARPQEKLLKGRVVLREKPEVGVAEATLSAEYTASDENLRTEGTSDRQGGFSVRRGKSEMYLHVVTPDRKLQGIVRVKPEENEVKVPAGPTASARGRLVDENGIAMANRTIEYGIRIDHAGGSFGYRFGGETKTGEDGSFEVVGLVPGYEYSLNLVMTTGDEGRPSSWRTVSKAKADQAERVELGDVKVLPPSRPRPRPRP